MKIIVNSQEEKQQILEDIRNLRKSAPTLSVLKITPEMIFVEKLEEVDSEREDTFDEVIKDLSKPKGMDADPIEFK